MRINLLKSIALAHALCLAGAGSAIAAQYPSYSGTQFLASTQILTGTSYQGYRIFGLSGIDYNPVTNQFIAVRDNFLSGSGNSGNPVAFTLAPVFSADGNSYTVAINGVNTLGGASGLTGLESIRYDKGGNGVWVSSEAPNAVYHIADDGSRTQLALPASVTGRTPAGASNYGLEGLTFTPGGDLWVSRENSLSGDATNIIRLSNIGSDGALVRQFAYTLDNVVSIQRPDGAIIANPPGTGVGNNGVAEILAVSDTEFFVMERGWDGLSGGDISHNYIRIYSVDISQATDVSAITNLDGSTAYTALTKTLIFDSQSAEISSVLNTLDTKIDNIEGMSFGPQLADGRQSLILVSDNNNSSSQRKTQFITLALKAGAVPEPATWAMMIAGFAGVGIGLRRQRARRIAVSFG